MLVRERVRSVNVLHFWLFRCRKYVFCDARRGAVSLWKSYDISVPNRLEFPGNAVLESIPSLQGGPRQAKLSRFRERGSSVPCAMAKDRFPSEEDRDFGSC
jgi:hypothetical protein